MRYLLASTVCVNVTLATCALTLGPAFTVLIALVAVVAGVIVGARAMLDLGGLRMELDHEARNGLPVARPIDTTAR
jgi:hypothetical protein